MLARPSVLERYELAADALPGFPVRWAEVFGREAPLAVEVGYGAGEYLSWWAGERPDWDFVGIELPHESVVRAGARLARARRENVRLIRGDARYLLRELFAPGSLRHVLMQFPMPWPKEKHAKHRVSSPAFAATLADVLEPDGTFELVTDQEWYAAETAAVLGAAGPFSVVARETGPDRAFRTRYESKWLEQGRAIFRVVVQLDAPRLAPRRFAADAMEVIHLSALPAAEACRALVDQRVAEGDCVYVVKEVFAADDGWLLYLVCSDESFSQHFYVRVVAKKDGRVLLRVQPRPRPYPTQAVRFALQDLGKRLESSAVGA